MRLELGKVDLFVFEWKGSLGGADAMRMADTGLGGAS
jgi:hypothetical protein